jgi:hypothetical protein
MAGKRRKFFCKPCDRGFSSKQALKTHQTRKHKKDTKRGPATQMVQMNFCPHCGRQLPNAIVI